MKQSALTIEERRAFRRAQRCGYLKTIVRNPRLASSWAAYCDRRSRPYVKLRVTGQYATLFFDCLQSNVVLTPQAQQTIDGLCGLIGGQWLKVTENFVWGSRIPLAQAELLAKMLIQLVKASSSAFQYSFKQVA